MSHTDGILAWHFAATQQQDGVPLAAPGGVETYGGKLVMRESGLHASENLRDTLDYAPGTLLRRVRLSGEILTGANKLCATRREVLWECEMGPALQLFARKCALDVAHLWEMPPIVLEYLMTGREGIRAAARDVAWAATWDATWAAAGAAASTAALAAAGAAASPTAVAVALAAASIAIMAVAKATAGAAAMAAARTKQEQRLVAYAQAARAGLFFGNA